MCSTKNSPDAQSCTYCGYIFENFDAGGLSAEKSRAGVNVINPGFGWPRDPKEESQGQLQENPAASPAEERGRSSADAPSSSTITWPNSESSSSPSPSTIGYGTLPPPPPSSSSSPSSSSPSTTISTSSPLFVVSKSLVVLLVPALAYLVIISITDFFSSFDIVSVALTVVFTLMLVLPIIFSPRRYEFFEDSLRIYKIIGGDVEIPYDDMLLHDASQMPGSGRNRQRIILSVQSRSRTIIIPGNPTSAQLDQNLEQFLSLRIRKPNPRLQNRQENSMQDAGPEQEEEEDSSLSRDSIP
jgi:hypothetical protein